MLLSVYLGAKSAEDNILDTEEQSPVQAAGHKIFFIRSSKTKHGKIDEVKMIKISKLKVTPYQVVEKKLNIFFSVAIVNPQCGSGSSFLPADPDQGAKPMRIGSDFAVTKGYAYT